MTTLRELLLGEWACLGALYSEPSHGFAVAELLRPGGDLGRIWSLSRPLTYRSIDVLVARGLLEHVGNEPGAGGPDRIVLRATRRGRAQLRAWVRRPVEHLRDLRAELLLKIAIAEQCGIDIAPMLIEQRDRIRAHGDAYAALAFTADGATADVVSLWRYEASAAGLRFLDRLG